MKDDVRIMIEAMQEISVKVHDKTGCLHTQQFVMDKLAIVADHSAKVAVAKFKEQHNLHVKYNMGIS